MKNPKMQVTLTPEMLNELKKISLKSGNAVASIVRTAIVEYLKNQEGIYGTK